MRSFYQGKENLELIDGKAVPKMAPKFFHARIQVALGQFLEEWGNERGWVGMEWAVL